MSERSAIHTTDSSGTRSLLASASRRTSSATSTPLFVSDRGAPRRRRPSDVVRLVVALATFSLIGWASSNKAPLDFKVLEFFTGLPNWIRTLAWFGLSASGLVAFGVAAAGVFLGGVGRGIARDLITATVLTVAVALISSRLTHGINPTVLPEIGEPDEIPAYPTLRTSLVVLVTMVLGPYVNIRMQRLLRWTIAAAVIAPLVLALSSVTSLVGAVSLSIASVAATRLAFGSPEGLPSIDRLGSTLERIGIELDQLAYLDEQPGTVGLATAVDSDGRNVDIKLYGVDAASRQQAERIWKALWYRPAGPSPRAGRIEQAQHEALAVLSAREAGVSVPPLLGAGQIADGDVLVVSGGARGVPLRDIDDIDDETLQVIWRDLLRLHDDAQISHGRIGPEAVYVFEDGAEFVDFANASMFPTEQQLATDVVSMLATLAIFVGADRALDSAVETVPADALAVALPYVQDAVLEPRLRSALGDADIKIKELRSGLAERLQIEVAQLAPVRWVKVSDLVIAIAAIFAANALISQISDVGLDTIIDELRGASGGWLVASFLIRLSAYFTAYIGLKAVVTQALPFLPTAILQSAKSFVGLVVPSLVGAVSMNIRYLQKLGVPVVVATTQGPVISFIGFIAEVMLLLVCSWAIGQELETDELFDVDAGGLVLIAVAVVVVGLIVVMAIPKLRAIVVPPVKEAIGSIRSIVTSPRTLAAIFFSEALDRVVGALALGATMAAFGASIPFAALVFVSVGTGLLAGIAPVPGGIGVAEATMSGLLTAVGLPAEQAVTIAIVHRVVTSYLPPVLGFFSLRWLNREGFL